jgi:orotate phosphoribosyltransferase
MDRVESTAARLLELLLRRSYLCRPEAPFVLASGKTSPIYIDCRLTTTYAEAIPLIGELCFHRVLEIAQGTPPAAVGGLTLGADPIAAAVSYYSTVAAQPISWFTVRKEAKQHGTARWIEGSVEAGARVVVVDDVVTTGASTLTAIERCRAHGLMVVGALALVDRCEDDGRRRIETALGAGCSFASIFTRADLDAAWQTRRR